MKLLYLSARFPPLLLADSLSDHTHTHIHTEKLKIDKNTVETGAD